MTEIEQLRADLQTLGAAASIASKMACPSIAKGIDSVCMEAIRKQIAALESEQSVEPDPWAEAKKYVTGWIEYPYYDDPAGRSVAKYVRHLEADLAKLNEELLCERIDGGTVLDQSKEIIAELKARLEGERIAFSTMAAHAAILLKERNEARAELAKRPVMEAADALEILREKLAELTTIANAIPPACPDALALVQARIDSVKKEMQGNE